MIEVESKFRLSDRQHVESLLPTLGFTAMEPVQQIDKVFLLNSDSFKGFTPGDPVARIRTVNGHSSMALKKIINDSGDTEEHELDVNPASSAEGLLLALGFQAVTHVEKTRTEYKQRDVTIALDEVTNLGSFAEIEILCAEADKDDVRQRVMTLAYELGFTDDDIVTKKYDQLLSEL